MYKLALIVFPVWQQKPVQENFLLMYLNIIVFLFAIATSDFQKNQILAAGESILASDIWHGTGARIRGLLLQTGAVLISIVMLKTNTFNRLTAVTGIVTHGLDLLHIIIGFFLPTIGIILMAIAGPLYLLWFPLVGLRLFKLRHLNN